MQNEKKEGRPINKLTAKIKNLTTKDWARLGWRLLFYLLGQFIITIGVVLSVNSNLGVSAGSSLPYTVSLILGGKITLGNLCTIFFLVLILIQLLLLRREFKIWNVLQILGSFLYGWFIDLSTLLVGGITPANYAGQIALILCSIVVQAFGISIYIDTNILPMPPEGTLLAIRRRLPKLSLGNTKMLFDCSIVASAVILSLIFFRTVVGVREGTLLLLLVGRVLGFFHKRLQKPLNRLFYGPEGKPAPAQEAEKSAACSGGAEDGATTAAESK